MADWDQRFLDLAHHISLWSKDPSTKVGAVAVSDARAVLETGYNGIPRGVLDLSERMERPAKYIWTVSSRTDNTSGLVA